MKTKLLPLLFCLLSTLPALADSFWDNGICYYITGNKTVAVTAGDKNDDGQSDYSGNINIPTQIQYNNQTYSVTAIDSYAFYRCVGLTAVTIPNSVTTIGQYAFQDCINLSSVITPNSVTTIGQSAFQGCAGLTSVTISNSVTTISSCAFQSCSSLTSVTIPNSVTAIGPNAFSFCSALSSVTIPNSVATIYTYAFSYCSSLTTVTIPNSVTTIGTYAFYKCSSLSQINVDSDNLTYTSIDGVLFNKAKDTIITFPAANSHEYIIPNSVKTINEYAFWGCSDLTAVTIPNSVTSISDYAFMDCSGLTSVTIPNSVTEIGTSAFSNCSSLTEVQLPNSVTKISLYTFSNCSSLTEVKIPNSVTEIRMGSFAHCSSLSSVTIPNSVTEIGQHAFSDCTALTSVTIPNSVTVIGDRAFDSSGLTDIYCEAEVPPICYYYTFARDTYLNGVLHVPAVAVEAYQRAEGWTRFANIVGFDNSDIEEPTWQDAVTIEAESTQALFVPYIWASSNEDVASVNQNGVITAIAPGTCTITLTCGETVYSCEVTVSNKSTGRTEISNVSPTKVYDLQGRRVPNPRRGIFIINGQKTLMK